MKTSRIPHAFLSAMLVLVCVGSAFADTVTVYGTGRNTSGVLLPGGAIDQNYILTADPLHPSESVSAYVVSALAGSGSIAQIDSLSPDVEGTGFYTYTTTFSLAGLDPSTAILTGTWGFDDGSGGFFLNGNLVPGTIAGNCLCFTPQSLNITSGFVAGTNTLSFVGLQADNFFDYVRVDDMTVTANPVTSTPEPGTLWMLGTGVVGVAGAVRRKFRH